MSPEEPLITNLAHHYLITWPMPVDLGWGGDNKVGIQSGRNAGTDNRKEHRQAKEKGWPPEIGRKRKEFHHITCHHSLFSVQVSTSGSVPKNIPAVPVR